MFLGDSITQQYELAGPPAFLAYRAVWDRFYGDRHALNLGFSGDATCHLLWRIENGEVAGLSPKVAVVLIGANNFGRLHWSADDTVRGVDAIVSATHTRLPASRIVLLSILPSGRGAWAADATRRANRALAERFGSARDDRVRFVNLTDVFEPDGHLDVSLFADPLLPHPKPALHPNAAGQARMAGAVEPVLFPLLGDRDHRS